MFKNVFWNFTLNKQKKKKKRKIDGKTFVIQQVEWDQQMFSVLI